MMDQDLVLLSSIIFIRAKNLLEAGIRLRFTITVQARTKSANNTKWSWTKVRP